ncbi:MAG: acyl carrier protein [Clostridia bacterium]|jgi:acyl carrier protein|nr:acyl carrier protein [Clostridia bacterium]
MLQDIINIICDFVEADPDGINENSSLRNDIGASSFDLMNIAVEIEQRYHVRVPDERLPLIKTVGGIMQLIGA